MSDQFLVNNIILHYNDKVYNMDQIYSDKELHGLVFRAFKSPNNMIKLTSDIISELNSTNIPLHFRIRNNEVEMFLLDKHLRFKYEDLFPPYDLG